MELHRLTTRRQPRRPYVISHGKRHAAVETITAILNCQTVSAQEFAEGPHLPRRRRAVVHSAQLQECLNRIPDVCCVGVSSADIL
jgi:hypothetical protein